MSVYQKTDFLDAANFRFVEIQNLNPPAFAFRIHTVHTVQVCGKQGGFLPADAAPDFYNDIAVVVRIAGEQQAFQFFLTALHLCLCVTQFLFRQIP